MFELVLHYARPLALALALAAVGCGGIAPPKVPITQQRPLATLLEVAAYPNSDTLVLLATMQQLQASHREREGYDYFGKLAAEQPARRTLLASLQAVMQARMANDVPLLQRMAWVEDAMRKLDAGAAADPGLGRLARGLVYAELPERFAKAQQAVDDLNAALAYSPEFPVNLERGIHRELAVAYRTLGQEAQSRQHLRSAGLASLDDPNEPRVLGEFSVDREHGFRFSQPRFSKLPDSAAGAPGPEGVYVAEGYDFGNIAFVVGRSSVVAIDAGTTEPTARAALSELRKITSAPIKYIVLTHAHWDHVGGLRALREPGSSVIAQANFPRQLEHTRQYRPPFTYFFGTQPVSLDVTPDRLVAEPQRLSDDDFELELIPAHSGETEDALFIFDRRHDVLFVGDAFMPYLGAPFVPEGSAQDFLRAFDDVIQLHPGRLVHGHPPLTALFRAEVMPALRSAFAELYQRSLDAARAARPFAELLNDDFIPASLRANPHAVMPYLVARDTFVQRLYAEQAGYWRSNGDGIEQFTRSEWSLALDAVGGHSADAFQRAAHDLESRGDAALALRIAELGLLRYPKSEPLQQGRARALTTLRDMNSPLNPFRFIVYSEMAGRGLAPLAAQQEVSRAPLAAQEEVSR